MPNSDFSFEYNGLVYDKSEIQVRLVNFIDTFNRTAPDQTRRKTHKSSPEKNLGL